jgi:SAM-dependent methyltransferase
MTGFVLSAFGHEVTLTDLEDWRDGRAKQLAFSSADICGCDGLLLEDAHFELCATYNSFEHFSDPERALSEMLRVLRPGGWLFAEFGPLYAGPWGLHAYRSLRMPYPQFLFSESFWRQKLHELGMRDLNRPMADLQPLNRWTIQQFRDLWKASGCETLSYAEGLEQSYLDIIERFPASFQGRGLTLEDVTIQSVRVLLRKKQS